MKRPVVWFVLAGICGHLVVAGDCASAQEQGFPVDSIPLTAEAMLDRADDADVEKVELLLASGEELVGYVLAVDSTAVLLAAEEYDNDIDEDTLLVLPLTEVLRVHFDDTQGMFPFFTIMIPALSIAIAEEINPGDLNVFLVIPLLPIGGAVDMIVAALDNDDSWSWSGGQKDVRLLREHAVFSAGFPVQLAAAPIARDAPRHPAPPGIPPASGDSVIRRADMEDLASDQGTPLVEILSRDGARRYAYIYAVNEDWLQYVLPNTRSSEFETVVPIHNLPMNEVASVRFDEERSISPYGTIVLTVAAGLATGTFGRGSEPNFGRKFLGGAALGLPIALLLEKLFFFLDGDDSWEWYPSTGTTAQLRTHALLPEASER